MQRDPDIDPITAKLQAEEQQLRRRTILLTLIPLLVAVGLIWFTSVQVSSATEELKTVTDSLEGAKEAVLTVQTERIRLLTEIDSLQTIKDNLFAQWEQQNVGAAQMAQEEAIKTYEDSRTTPRVYLHIMNKNQYPKAKQFQANLEAAGFSVPGIEVVSWQSETSDLRVFKEDDIRTAQRIVVAAKRRGVVLNLQDLSARYAKSTDLRSGHFEIWLGRNFVP